MKKLLIATAGLLATAAIGVLAYNYFNAAESDDSAATDGSVEPSETVDADASAPDAEIHASDIM